MHVAEEEDVSALQRPLHHQLRMVVDGIELARRPNPLPIQILPHQRAPVVAYYDAIWIEHGYDLEDESVSEELGSFFIAHQEVEYPIHHP